MAEYHQRTLFDLEIYASEPSGLEKCLDSQSEDPCKKVEFEQIELDFSPKLSQLTQLSFERLSQAA